MTTTPKGLSDDLTAELRAAMKVAELPEQLVATVGAALASYIETRNWIAVYRDGQKEMPDFLKQAKALEQLLSPRAVTLLEQVRESGKPGAFQELRDSLARAIAALSPDESSWYSSGRRPRGNRQHARELLRLEVLNILHEQTAIDIWPPTAGRGAAGDVVKAVMREADRLDGSEVLERTGDIKPEEWAKWVDDFFQKYMD